uniref:NADH-ubiquinone oxidoreductase chain 4 n=1 Tax=Cotesia vestalis TaxID=217443 RepID=D8KZD9_COTVE|nr:NADH dehydrogenase subunit 4 [Cotesia vestalis]ACH71091.1 NADH dehydrogenase subunit 4 [Cotesia vestalis]
MLKLMLMIFFLNFMFKKKYIFLNHLILMIIMFMFLMKMNLNNFYYNNIFYMFMYDNISYFLILLSFWIIILSNLANFNFLKNNYNMYFVFILNNLLFFLILCFLSMNLLFFYIFFESSIIPVLLLIMGWGMQIDRLQSSMYLLLYTLFGSLPLFMMIMLIYKNFFSLMFMFLNMNLLNNLNYYLMNYLTFIFMILGFLIKMPMYFFHLWLPKAHVEAPISGSMILAGVMLKLGSYGLIRLMIFMKYLFMNFNLYIINLSLIGGIYASMMCLNINDYKIIVAYSSIVHMSSLMSSMLTLNYWGYLGSYIMMISHGLCSSSLFYLVNLNYERTHSRSLNINKGLINILPSLSLWWFLICIINMSAPPSMNLISEIMMFNSLITWSYYMILYMLILSFFSSCYSIMIFSFSQHGKLNFNLFNFKMINCMEFFIIILHWIPLNFIILNLNLMFYFKYY